MNKKYLIPAAFAVLASIIGINAMASINNNAKSALLMAIDDEYRAYSTYVSVMEKFGEIKPFVNIAQAELRHIEALENLLIKYGIEIPKSPYLTSLLAAPESVSAACAIGVQAEIDNAKLYDEKLMPLSQGYEDIQTVFQNLRDASQERHLPAFQRCVQGGGMGKGMGQAKGKGQGGGMGKGHGGGF